MLRTLFDWLDVHPGSYWILAYGATLLLTAWIAAEVWRESRGPASERPRAAGYDALLLFLFLLAWRWPFLLAANDYNPDESQLVAGAITLTHDPVFWRSVDGGTSGPLNFYVLLPLHWLGAPLDYFMARVTGLLLIWGALLACHRTLAGSFGRAAAWLGVLPVAGFFATITHPDLVHFSTEHLPLFQIALAIWLLAGRNPGDRLRLWAACFLAGCACWTKLQAAPISVTLIGWGLWQVMREPGVSLPHRLRRVAGAGLAAVAPTLLALALIAATGQMEMAVRRYIMHNLLYVGNGGSLWGAMYGMYRMATGDGRLLLLLAVAVVVLLAATVHFIVRRRRPPALFAVGGLLTLAAVLAVITPRREFLHYALLLPVPLTLWMGAAMGGWWSGQTTARARLCLAGVLFLVAGLPAVLTRGFQQRPSMFGNFAHHWRHPRIGAAVLARALAGPDGSLAIWGWANNFYVESGLPQATSEANSGSLIYENAQRDEHRAHYFDELRRNRPEVFIDSVGPAAFGPADRATQAHETFPELADYIEQNYTFVTELGPARIYGRNDLETLSDMTADHIEELLRQGR